MKYRVIAITIILILSVVLGACSNQPNNNSGIESQEGASSTDSVAGTEATNGDDELPGIITLNLSSSKISFGAPGTVDKRANTGYIIRQEEYYVIYDCYVDPASNIEYGVDLNSIKKAADVWQNMKTQIIETAKNGLSRSAKYVINYEDSTIIKSNGYELCKTSGTIEQEDGTDYDFVGYSAYVDGTPLYFMVIKNVLGSTFDISEIAEKIALTIK